MCLVTGEKNSMAVTKYFLLPRITQKSKFAILILKKSLIDKQTDERIHIAHHTQLKSWAGS